MRLMSLNIRRKSKWEDKEEHLTGTVEFEKEGQVKVSINVSEAAATKIVELCADGIIDAGHELAQIIIDDLDKRPIEVVRAANSE